MMLLHASTTQSRHMYISVDGALLLSNGEGDPGRGTGPLEATVVSGNVLGQSDIEMPMVYILQS